MSNGFKPAVRFMQHGQTRTDKLSGAQRKNALRFDNYYKQVAAQQAELAAEQPAYDPSIDGSHMIGDDTPIEQLTQEWADQPTITQGDIDRADWDAAAEPEPVTVSAIAAGLTPEYIDDVINTRPEPAAELPAKPKRSRAKKTAATVATE